jgi:serine/threonine protein kinase
LWVRETPRVYREIPPPPKEEIKKKRAVPFPFSLLFRANRTTTAQKLTAAQKHSRRPTIQTISMGASVSNKEQKQRQKQPTQGGTSGVSSCLSLGSIKASLPFSRRRGRIQEEYDFGTEELGRGHYGVVFKGVVKKTGKIVAIKRITKRNLEKKAQLMIEREIECMNRLNDNPHPNIVKMLDMHEDAKYYYLVLEMCGGGELFDEILSKGKFSEEETKKVMKAILHSVKHMHAKGIVHRDLKPENIIYCQKTMSVKMIDFGLARPEVSLCTRPNLSRFKSRVGTPYYIAPEVIRKDYSESCDEWSCGVILYILLCGFPPFNGPSDAEIFKRVKQGTFSFPNPEWHGISAEAKDLVTKLLDKNPETRITAEEALKSSWFDEAIAENPGSSKSEPAITLPSASVPLCTTEAVVEDPVVEEPQLGATPPNAATKEEAARDPSYPPLSLSALMDKTAGITNGARQAKVVLEHLSSQAMGNAWRAWAALQPA